MKRKTTELEQKLIDNGFVLAQKRYTGKRSEKTLCYEYVKDYNLIRLDSKREKILLVGIRCVMFDLLTESELRQLRIDFWNLKSFAKSLLETPKPLVVSPSESDERVEIAPMTPEQFDELCKENE